MPAYGRRRPPTALDQLIADLKSVLRMDPPAARVVQHGGAVVTFDYLVGGGIGIDAFLERAAAAGLIVKGPDYGQSYYLVTTK